MKFFAAIFVISVFLFTSCKKEKHTAFAGEIDVPSGDTSIHSQNSFTQKTDFTFYDFDQIAMGSGWNIISFDSVKVSAIAISTTDTSIDLTTLDSITIQIKSPSQTTPQTIGYNFSSSNASKSSITLNVSNADILKFIQNDKSYSLILNGHLKKAVHHLFYLTVHLETMFGAYARRRASFA